MKRRISAFLATLLLLAALAPAALAFSDVPYDHWAWGEISRANRQGWVSGVGGDRYNPERAVNAAEFLTMVANAFYPEELAAQEEGDIWYRPVWALARELALNEGTSVEDEEDLMAPLPRQDMARILCNVLSAKGLPLPKDGGTFADQADIAPDCRAAVSAAAALGILNGKGENTFAPLDPVTRAQAAAVLCRMDEALYPVEVIRLVNEERAKEGLSSLRMDGDLMAMARIRAEELQILFDHTRPNGTGCGMVAEELGLDPYDYIRYGENIASGQPSPAVVMDGWMHSPGHRMNIMDPGFAIIGVGYQNGRWVQIFARKDG